MSNTVILDLDLDFFLDRIAHFRSIRDGRLDDSYKPWRNELVKVFLDEKCALQSSAPIPGKLLKHHDELFFILRQMFRDKRIDAPVHLVHVDAHDDLGCDSSLEYVLTDYFNRSLEDRYSPETGTGKLHAGNFLVFLAACGWLSKMTFVHHPQWDGSLPSAYFKNDDPSTQILDLQGYDARALANPVEIMHLHTLKSKTNIACIPFRISSMDDFFLQQPPDYLFLTQSPQFTPVSSDALIPEIMNYVSEV